MDKEAVKPRVENAAFAEWRLPEADRFVIRYEFASRQWSGYTEPYNDLTGEFEQRGLFGSGTLTIDAGRRGRPPLTSTSTLAAAPEEPRREAGETPARPHPWSKLKLPPNSSPETFKKDGGSRPGS
jgi:hypothetical protein